MGSTNKDKISVEEAKQALQSIGRRLGLLHLCYARTIIEELGEEQGMKVIAKAIKDFGIRIGEKTKQEVLDKGMPLTPENFSYGTSYALPAFPGLHDKLEMVQEGGRSKVLTMGCILAKVWEEYGEENLGRLYCYMDPAKYMAYNPDYKLSHNKALPDGDDCCELEVKKTTEKEKKDFFSKDADWFYIDK